jgi:3D (Asp-Asp-Asp) domain-containing protein
MFATRVLRYFGFNTLTPKRTKWLAAGLAVFAAVVGLYPFDSRANVNASLISTLPVTQSQVFDVQDAAKINAAQDAPVKKKLAKQAPKYKVLRTMTVSATAYNSEVAQTDNSPMYSADGTWVFWGMVAMNGQPFGTKIRIPKLYGDKIFTVHDRGGFGTTHVDIWMKNHADAIQFGRRTITIEFVQ